jgi:hypothetical protein
VSLGLGHAGVLTFDPQTGRTRYYEYGRYQSDFGNVERRIVPDLSMGPDSQPTADSWSKLMDYLSRTHGKGRPISPQCRSDSDFNRANEFAEQRMRDPQRRAYSWNPFNPNHCSSFAWEVVNAGRGR